ncbi:hypothetical protein [Burkholderia seminalis]|uniref:hypothetical protein n=1 Tax=Burkholderia seminalis TaxID=488731 RepID=UPI00158BFC9B|nr:hypothetical protein [Burkholderia seminalis]
MSKSVLTGERVFDDGAAIRCHSMRVARPVAASGFGRASGFIREMRGARTPVERGIDVTPAVVVETNVKLTSRVTAASDR